MPRSDTWKEVTRSTPCAICGHGNWCVRSSDGAACCRRVDNGRGIEKLDHNGGAYWFYPGEGGSQRAETKLPAVPIEPPRAMPVVLDRVYRSMLGLLSLSSEHRKALQGRGLTDVQIDALGYRTLPKRERAMIAQSLVEQHGPDVCAGIPGLYVKRDAGDRPYWSLAGAAGLLVPVRQLHPTKPEVSLIVGMQIRVDDPQENAAKYIWLSSSRHDGPGPGAPLHIPLWTGETVRVRATEGVLKADVATMLSGILTVGTPGVSQWRALVAALLSLKAETARLAFDADACRNQHVAKALSGLASALTERGLGVELELWEETEGKGIDDLLADGGTPQVLRGEPVQAAITGLVNNAQLAERQRNQAQVVPDEPVPLPEEAPELPDQVQYETMLTDGEAPPEAFAHELHLTDLGNALRFVQRHGKNLRYCWEWDKWLVWDGTRWCRDAGDLAWRLAVESVQHHYSVAKRIETNLSNPSARDKALKVQACILDWAKKSEHVARISAMLKHAQAIEGIPAQPGDFDANDWLFNCRNGTIDLVTGQLREHNRKDLITKLAPVKFDPHAPAPVWRKFLHEVMPDVEVQAYLQRAGGYTLTGVTGAEAIFFPYGTGRNGKSKFLAALEHVMGDYAKPTPRETLLSKDRGSGIPNDVAALAGVRFVPSFEVEEGRRLDVSLIKQLTGGDRVSARFLHGEFFDFYPKFKIWFSVNHKPRITDTTDSIWERVKLLPFVVTIPRESRDPELLVKFRKEASGILAWLVQGCLEWQKQGLNDPDAVKAAVGNYREEMDTLAGFLADCCVISMNARVYAAALYAAYQKWSEQNGERATSQKAFGMRLTERGFDRARGGAAGRFYWMGLGLVDMDGSDVPEEVAKTLFSGDETEPSEPSEPYFPVSTETRRHESNGVSAETRDFGSDGSEGSVRLNGHAPDPEAERIRTIELRDQLLTWGADRDWPQFTPRGCLPIDAGTDAWVAYVETRKESQLRYILGQLPKDPVEA